jgi:acyl-CoA thioester hydrolase
VNEFSWPVRVYYEDTDLGGVVYYANYLKFMERARTEWLRALGFEQDELITKNDVIFAVRNVEVEYIKPARFNDQLTVTVRPVELGRASLALQQEITKDKGLEMLCKGKIKIASLKASTFRPCPIPASIQEKLTK